MAMSQEERDHCEKRHSDIWIAIGELKTAISKRITWSSLLSTAAVVLAAVGINMWWGVGAAATSRDLKAEFQQHETVTKVKDENREEKDAARDAKLDKMDKTLTELHDWMLRGGGGR